MKNILLVCTGNTCRSAMGEALFDDAVDRSSSLRGKVRVDSAGTFACEDTEATPQAIEVMAEMGHNIEKHRAKQIDKELVEWADIIFTMEATHFEQIEAMFPEAEKKMHTIMGYARGELGFPGDENFSVADPYGGDLEEYRACAEQLQKLIVEIVAILEKEKA